MGQIHELIVAILMAIGLNSGYDIDHVVKHSDLPKLVVAGEMINSLCNGNNHLGCYSGTKNIIFLKSLRFKNRQDYKVLSHELYHFVQFQSGKRSNLEHEAHRFDRTFQEVLEETQYFEMIPFGEIDKAEYALKHNRETFGDDADSTRDIALYLKQLYEDSGNQKQAQDLTFSFSNSFEGLSKYFNL